MRLHRLRLWATSAALVLALLVFAAAHSQSVSSAPSITVYANPT